MDRRIPAGILLLLGLLLATTAILRIARSSRLEGSRDQRQEEKGVAPEAIRSEVPTSEASGAPPLHWNPEASAREREATVSRPARSHRQDPFPGAPVLATRDSEPDARGRITRIKILRTDFKYPFIRMVETVKRGRDNGAEEIEHRVEMVADHVLVRLLPGKTQDDLRAVNRRYGTRIRKKMYTPSTYLVELAGRDLDAVTRAVRDYSQETDTIEFVEPDTLFHATITPGDTRYNELWGMHNVGQTGGTSDADIDAPEAWNVSTGSASVRVGVIDSGVDYTHPDLAPNIWSNPGEVVNGSDDDGNGFIDDVRGWDFYNDDADPMDDNDHGTHVAGTIGAAGNNGLGVTGVCWQVSIVPIKFLGASGSGSLSDSVDAVTYATTLGLDLTNNSWGSFSGSQSLRSAIQAADAAGILFVAAAGNDSVDTDAFAHFPSSYTLPNIISVAATDHRDDLAVFSNWGATSVDLSAPGVSILSTDLFGSYQSLSGTSMAAPHVAGVAALLKSNTPALTAGQIKSNILSSVDPIPALSGLCTTGGRLNAFEAIVTNTGPYLALLTFALGDDGTLGTIGNGNGVANAGERVGILVAIANVGSGQADGVTATVSFPGPMPWATIVQNAASYGTIAPQGATVSSQAYLFDINAATPDQTVISLTLDIRDNQGGQWFGSLAFVVQGSVGISGTVTLDGQPVGGATIEYRGPIEGIVQTAGDGTYQIQAVPGTFDVVCKRPGLATSDPIQVTVPPDATGVDFTYTSRTISGTVTDGDSGAPLQGATVVYGGPLSGQVSTDASGNYSVTLGVSGTKIFAVQATKPDTHTPSSPLNVTLPPDALGTDFQLFGVRYTIADLGTLGGTTSFANGLSEDGKVVGMALDSQGDFHAFLWDGGTMTDLGTVTGTGTASSEAYGVNSAGQVVGKSTDTGGSDAFLWETGTMTAITGTEARDINESGQAVTFDGAGQGFLWESGVPTNLGTLGGNTVPQGLNNAAWVVGTSGPTAAFLWQAGAMSNLGSLAGGQTAALDVNNFGQIVGSSGDKAFVWQSGRMSPLQTQLTDESYGLAVNDVGQVVGYATPNTVNDPRATLWENGLASDLNFLIPQTLGWSLKEARDINSAGEIVGFGTIGGQTRAFLLSPVKAVPQSPPVITAPPTATPDPIRIPQTAVLAVTAQDDGLPVPPGGVIYTWSVETGPGGAVFTPNGTGGSDQSTASFINPGVYTLKITVSDGTSSVSDTVGLTVYSSDQTPPGILAVAANGITTQVKVAFDELVNQAIAEVDTNYTISGGITVSSASLGADNRTVTLQTSPLSSGTVYTLTVNNIEDLSFPANTIPPNTQANFQFNALPVAQDLNPMTAEDTPVGVTLQATDADSPSLTYEIVDLPPNGTLSGTPPNITYTPAQDFVGVDTFTYRADDGEVSILAAGNTATVTVTVTPVNDPPVARDITIVVPVNVGSPITLIATDVENDPLTYGIVAGPTSGALSGTPPNVTYTPNPAYVGPDSFTYQADDGSLPSNVATVSITVQDNTLWAWGHNGNGRLGDGTSTNQHSPVQITAISDVVWVDGGDAHTAVVKADGTVWNWGLGNEGQLGDGTKNSSVTPVQVTALGSADGVSAGHRFTLAVLSDGTVWGWGYNTEGQLGMGSTGGPGAFDQGWDTPQQAVGLTNADAVSAGFDWAMALLSNGTVQAWGNNGSGQVGDGTNIDRHAPVAVSGLSNIDVISAGASHALALDGNGIVWAWGRNFDGELGDGTNTDSNVPVQVTGLTGVVAISAGSNASRSFAVKSDGTVWAWGQNNGGDLGVGDALDRNVPTQVLGLTGAAKVAAGNQHTLALKGDGTLWAWGDNLVGQIGDGTTTDRHSPPVQVPGLLGVSTPATGNLHSLGLVATTGAPPSNYAPVAQDLADTTPEESLLGITLVATDADGDPLTYTLVTLPTGGTLSGTPPNLIYTPDLDFFGPDSFTFTATDGIFVSNVGTVSLTVTNVNDLPTALNDTGKIVLGRTLSATAPGVLGNDTDPDGDTLTAQLTATTPNGTLTLNPDGSYDYTPNAGFTGTDLFAYEAHDGQGTSNTAQVRITVTLNQVPVASDETYRVNIDRELGINAPNGLLRNDSDGDLDPLTAVLVTGPSDGTLTLQPDGSFEYQPDPGFTGSDFFTYTANDGLADSNVATTTILVRPVTVRPSAKVVVSKIIEFYDPAVGIPNEIVMGLGQPQVNETGTVLVQGFTNTEGTTSLDEKAIWLRNASGAMSLRVRTSGVAPGTGGAEFKTFVPVLNDRHDFATNCQIMGTGVISSNASGIWDTHGSPTLRFLARAGFPIPGSGGEPLQNLSNVSFSRAGAAFQAVLTTSQREVLWGPDATGMPIVILMEGDLAPGTTGAVIKNFAGSQDPRGYLSLNDRGEMVFAANLEIGPGGVTSSDDAGIWIWPGYSGTPVLLVRKGFPAPGGGGLLFTRTFGSPRMNDAGQVSFFGYMDVGQSSSELAKDEGIWGPDIFGGLTLRVRENDPAPGLPPGGRFGSPSAPVMNREGEIAFLGEVRSADIGHPNPEAIWVSDGLGGEGGWKMIARTGTTAPGTGGQTFYGLQGPSINARGDVAFGGRIGNIGPGGLWVYSAALDRVFLVALQGELFEVNPGDFRMVSSGVSIHEWRGDQDGGPRSLNGQGKLVFTLLFNDGTKATFIATIPANSIVPVAEEDLFYGDQDTVFVSTAPGVLANDSDPLGSPLTATELDPPQAGALTLNADGSFTYTPNGGFSGTDSFTYFAENGTDTSIPVTATIVVRSPSPIGFTPGVLTGDPAPGLAAGDTFVDFDDRVGTIDKDGRVGFVASVDGPSGSEKGVWAGPLGALGKVATTLDTAPGSALPFVTMNTPGHDGTGKVTFFGGVSNGSGVFSTQTGSLERVAFTGDQLPAEPAGSTVYQIGDEGRMNGSSEVLLRAFSQGPAINAGPGIWLRDGSGVMTRAIRGDNVSTTGDPAPGAPAGVVFQVMGDTALAGSGLMAFTSSTYDPSSLFRGGIWKGTLGALDLLVGEADNAPGMVDSGGTPRIASFGAFFSDLGLNDAGQAVFISQGWFGGTGHTAIWTGSVRNGLSIVAQEDTQAPDLPAGVNFHTLYRPVINSNGVIAFRCEVTVANQNNSDGYAIYVGTPGNLTLVAREGLPAPGTPAGVLYDKLGHPSLNGADDVAFSAWLAGNVQITNDRAIFATLGGTPTLVVREQDVIEVQSGDYRRINELNFDGFTLTLPATIAHTGNEDGKPSLFNDQGYLVFWAEFVDTSQGLIVASTTGPPLGQSAPAVTGVTSQTPDGAYGVGENIDITVTFSQLVTLSGGNLLVTLDTGAVVQIPPFGPASSASGTYVVGAGETTSDLTAQDPLTLSGGATLQNTGGLDAQRVIPNGQNLGDQKDISIDTVDPTITVTPPPATTTTTPLVVTGTASDPQGVSSVTWSNATTGGSGVATGTTSWSASVPLTPGTNVITIIVWDAAGNTDSFMFSIDYTPADTQDPVVDIDDPTTATTYAHTGAPSLTVGGTASDNVGVTTVTWDNAATGGSGTATGTTAWSEIIPLTAGSNLITITAEDAAGNTGTDQITVDYTPPPDTTDPTVAITTPTGTGSHATGTTPVVLGGTAGDNVGVSSVTWTNAGTGGNGTATGTTTWSAPVPLAAGANLITVTAHDAAGNTATDQITVTYTPPPDTIDPIISILSPTSSGTLATSATPVLLGGTAADNVALSTVVWSNAATTQSGSATGLATWTASVDLASGVNVVTLTATDTSGNTASAVITITYTPGGGGGGGGGGSGGGGCGLTGLEAVLLLAFVGSLGATRKRLGRRRSRS